MKVSGRVITLANVLLVSCLLCAPVVAQTSGSGAKATITFAARTETGNVMEARNLSLARFAAKYPNITVKREEMPQTDFWIKITAEIAGGQCPDVISLPYLEQAVTFAGKGLLEPLDAYIDGSSGLDRKDWIPELSNMGVYGGKQLVLPVALMTTGLGYNKDMFDKAGVAYPTANWTWDDMLAAAKKLTLDDKGRNAGDPAFNPDKIVQWGIYTWWWNSDFDLYLWTFGGNWLSEDGKTCLLDSPQALAALTFYGDLTQKYHVAPYLRELAPAHGHPAMMQKQVAMAFIDIGNIALVDGAGINWGMAPIPFKKDVGKRAAFLYGDGVAILKGAQNKAAGWELAKWLAGPDMDPQLAKAGYGFPPYKSAMARLAFSPKVNVLLDMVQKGWTRAIRATDYQGMVVTPCNTLMESALAKGSRPDYKALLQQATAQCTQAIQDAPPLQ